MLCLLVSNLVHAGDAWNKEPYWQPVVGATLYTSGGSTRSALYGGLEGGVRYNETGQMPRLVGRTRVRGVLTFGGDATATDVRLGSFLGPRWKLLGVQAGPDLFRDELIGSGLGPSIGVDLPVITTAYLKPLTLSAGLSPAWLADTDRRVDWSTSSSFGFGHEFTLLLGGMVSLGDFAAGLGWSRRTTVAGTYQGFAISFRV